MTNGTRVSPACRPSNQSSFPEKASARRRAHVATGLGLLETIGPGNLDGVWPGACRHRRASCAAGAGTQAVAGDRCVPIPGSRPRASTRASTRGGPTTCCRGGASGSAMPQQDFVHHFGFRCSAGTDAVPRPAAGVDAAADQQLWEASVSLVRGWFKGQSTTRGSLEPSSCCSL